MKRKELTPFQKAVSDKILKDLPKQIPGYKIFPGDYIEWDYFEEAEPKCTRPTWIVNPILRSLSYLP